MHPSKSESENSNTGTFRIQFSSIGAKPPIYIAGTFTNPPWLLLKMESKEVDESGEYKSEIKLKAARGQDYQYKFRVGEGEDWDLNQEEPIVVDEMGNRNNLLPTGHNASEWKETNRSDRSGEVIEERTLTKFAVEERKKVAVSSRANLSRDNEPESVQNIPSGSANTNNKGKAKPDGGKLNAQQTRDTETNEYSDNHRGDELNTLVSEVPATPSPTPAVDIGKTTGPVELKFQKALQKTKLPLDTKKMDEKLSSHESSKPISINNSYPFDAESENRKNQQKIRNLDIANTAAEVADMAAILDQEPLTPPISDAEAGRVGLRRMSVTPIPEVARVAAEVADVAATLDDENSAVKSPLQLLDEKAERLFGSGNTTPIEEKVPRFSHECPLSPNEVEPRKSQAESIFNPLPSRQDVRPDFSLNDSSIQLFPTDRDAIIAKLIEIQERLPEDEAHFEGVPSLPVIQPEQWSMMNILETQPPNFENGQPNFLNSQSGFQNGQPTHPLHSITEEDDNKDDDPHSKMPAKEESSVKSHHALGSNELEQDMSGSDTQQSDQDMDDSGIYIDMQSESPPKDIDEKKDITHSFKPNGSDSSGLTQRRKENSQFQATNSLAKSSKNSETDASEPVSQESDTKDQHPQEQSRHQTVGDSSIDIQSWSFWGIISRVFPIKWIGSFINKLWGPSKQKA